MPAPTPNRAKVDARGRAGIFQRLRDLNLESYHDFLIGMRQWTNINDLIAVARQRAETILRAHGLDAHTVDLATVYPLFEADPQISLWGRAYMDGQYYKFKT